MDQSKLLGGLVKVIGDADSVVQFEMLDLLTDIKNGIDVLTEQSKPHDYFERIAIDPTDAHTEERYKFEDGATIKKILILPVSHPITIWVDELRDSSKYVLNRMEALTLDQTATSIYYTNTAASSGTSEIRIHIFGHVKGAQK